MNTTTVSDTALRAVTAYGGADRWRAAEAVEATFDAGGLLVRWKRRGVSYRGIRVHARVGEPSVRMEDFEPGTVAILHGHDVRLERPDGTTILERESAREYFPFKGRRLLAWDAADFAYFIGYAIWNYLTFPALLLNDEIAWREIGEHALESSFPAHLPTHNQKAQQFYFDPSSGHLHEYDYVPEVYGGWAKAAHIVTEHADNAEGLVYPSKRRVMPRKPPAKGPGALPGPLMMFADIRDYKVIGPDGA